MGGVPKLGSNGFRALLVILVHHHFYIILHFDFILHSFTFAVHVEGGCKM